MSGARRWCIGAAAALAILAGAASVRAQATVAPAAGAPIAGAPIAGLQAPSLTVEEAVRLASGSESLRLKSIALQKSEAKLVEARAQGLPKLSLGLSGSLLANPPEGITVARGELGTITLPPPLGITIVIPSEDIAFVPNAEPTYYQLDATLTQPLVTWGKIGNAIRLAALGRDTASVEVAREGNELRRQVSRAYFGALLAERSRAILAEMSVSGDEVAADTGKRFEEGDVAKQAVLEAQATSAMLRARVAEAEETGATARESLAFLTGAPAGSVLASRFRDTLPALDEEAMQARAQQVCGDLELARLRVAQAGVALEAARGAAAPRPDIAASLSFSVTGQRTPFTSDTWDSTWDWDLVLSLAAKGTVFDAGASAARVRQAQADLDAATTALSQARKLVRLAVRTAIERARTAAASLADKEADLARATEVERNARVSFDNGLATRAGASTAEIGTLSARLARELALATLEDSMEEIERLCGGLR